MFNCELCNYSTNIKCNFIKHKNTKKHKNRLLGDIHTIPHKPQNSTKIMCEFCNKSFSRIDSLNRHLKSFCKENPDGVNSNIDIQKMKERENTLS